MKNSKHSMILLLDKKCVEIKTCESSSKILKIIIYKKGTVSNVFSAYLNFLFFL